MSNCCVQNSDYGDGRMKIIISKLKDISDDFVEKFKNNHSCVIRNGVIPSYFEKNDEINSMLNYLFKKLELEYVEVKFSSDESLTITTEPMRNDWHNNFDGIIDMY
jgi:hypothetical protein